MTATMPEYWTILGNWLPTDPAMKYNSFTLSEALKQILKSHRLDYDDFQPRDYGYAPSGRANEWHQDGDEKKPVSYIAIWANVTPSLMRRVDQPACHFTANPGDFVLLNNRTMEHKTPYPIPENRLFVRFWGVTPVILPDNTSDPKQRKGE